MKVGDEIIDFVGRLDTITKVGEKMFYTKLDCTRFLDNRHNSWRLATEKDKLALKLGVNLSWKKSS